MNEDIIKELELAKTAMKNSYDPYTNFKVGSVLVAKSGKKYIGCNVSNYGIQSICAERVAFVKAISEGEKLFERIIVVGGKSSENLQECLPCGYCRQFMSEFVDEDFKIYTFDNNKVKEYKMSEILPYSFKI